MHTCADAEQNKLLSLKSVWQREHIVTKRQHLNPNIKFHFQVAEQRIKKIIPIHNYGIVIALTLYELAICQFNCDKV